MMNNKTKDDFPDFLDESGVSGMGLPHEDPLVYEETPIIDPVTGTSTPISQENLDEKSKYEIKKESFEDKPIEKIDENIPLPPQMQKVEEKPIKNTFRKNNFFNSKLVKSTITLLIFIILFCIGIFVSIALRNFLTKNENNSKSSATITKESKNEVTEENFNKTSESENQNLNEVKNKYESWNTHYILTAYNKNPVEKVSYKLPKEVQDPICDGASCISQGTNLLGGNRFTTAARGKGQGLPLTKGAKLIDTSGRLFVLNEEVVNGINTRKFVGDFSGRTLNGYSFSKIVGYIFSINDNLEIEISLFAPLGQKSEWDSDYLVFGDIIKSLDVGNLLKIEKEAKTTSSVSAQVSNDSSASNSSLNN